MSISFAAPPVIKRDNDCSESKQNSSSTLISSFAGPSSATSLANKERHGSVSSQRSNVSLETSHKRPRSPEHKRSFEKKRVSFSTLNNENANMISLTLRTKHEAYKYSRRSRSFIIGYNDDEYSKSAMEWLLDTMVDDGDEIVALRVMDPSTLSLFYSFCILLTANRGVLSRRHGRQVQESGEEIARRNHRYEQRWGQRTINCHRTCCGQYQATSTATHAPLSSWLAYCWNKRTKP